MNLEDLRAAQTRERATDGLQELRDSFYSDVADYLQELKERRDAAAAAADDPFGDPEVQELTDKIETAEQVAEAIYERRMGKLVKQASLAAAGMPDEEDGLTEEERALYSDLVDRIEENKAHVLDVISGDAGGGSASGDARDRNAASRAQADAPDTSGAAETGEASAADAMGSGLPEDATDSSGDVTDAPLDGAAEASSESIPETPADAQTREAGDARRDTDRPEQSDAGAASDPAEASGPDAGVGASRPPREADGVTEDAGSTDGGVDRTTVRVTDDVGEIFGVDERPYTLEAEDVVALPEENAKPLVEKGAAEQLDN